MFLEFQKFRVFSLTNKKNQERKNPFSKYKEIQVFAHVNAEQSVSKVGTNIFVPKIHIDLGTELYPFSVSYGGFKYIKDIVIKVLC